MHLIGFVGLGAMGSVMAPLLPKAGFSVLGFDIAKTLPVIPQVKVVDHLSELVKCDAIILMLPSSSVVETVLMRLAELGYKGLVIDMSSCHPESTIDLEKKLNAFGIQIIDAPVSGGVKKASSGKLTIMVGGSKVKVKAAERLISCFGTPHHIGPLGAGHAMKALNNYVSAAGLLATMQALATAETFGISASTFTNVINGSTGRNNTTEVKLMPYIASRQYNSGFFLKLMAKDVGIANDLITKNGFDSQTNKILSEYLFKALELLGHNVDHTALYELVNPEKKTVEF